MTWYSLRMSEDERWPRGDPDVIRCACGAPALCREYRRSRRDGQLSEPFDEKFVCLAHSIGTTRISCELPNRLLARLERQAEIMETARASLIETAIETLVQAFEEIDTQA